MKTLFWFSLAPLLLLCVPLQPCYSGWGPDRSGDGYSTAGIESLKTTAPDQAPMTATVADQKKTLVIPLPANVEVDHQGNIPGGITVKFSATPNQA